MAHDDDSVMDEYWALDRDIVARQGLMMKLTGGAPFEYSPEQVVARQNMGPVGRALLRHILEGQPADDETIQRVAEAARQAA